MENIVINLHGPICSGKTTIAKLLHAKIPRTFIISGDRIKWLISDYEAVKDRDIISLMVFDISKRALEAGFNLIKDSNYMLWKNSDIASKYNDLFLSHGVKLFQFNLEAPKDVLIQRLHNRVDKLTKENKKISVKNTETFEKYYEKYFDMKNSSLETFDTSTQSPEEIVNFILEKIYG